MNPLRWWDGLDSGTQALLAAQERIRAAEEDQAAAAMVQAAAGGRARL